MKPNQQPIEKNTRSLLLEVISAWTTIQGEGPFAGIPAVFVRLAGCNLQCPLCDTDYTTGRESLTPRALLDHIMGIKDVPRLMVITGGEPFRQNLVPFVDLALAKGFHVQIETNGSLHSPTICNYARSPIHAVTIVCSPKSAKLAKGFYANDFKYVLEAAHICPEDGLPLSVLGNKVKVARPPSGFQGDIYVQPIDVQDEKLNASHMKATVESVLKHGHRLCLQLHKIVGLE